MDEDLEKDQENLPKDTNEQEQEGSPFDQSGNVSSNAQRVGKKALSALRGAGAATESTEGIAAAGEAGAVAEGVTAATSEGVTAGAAAGEAGAVTTAAAAGTAETATTTTAIATAGGSGIGMAGVAIFVILLIFVITVITTIGGGGATVFGGTSSSTPPGPLPIYGCADNLDGILASHNITVTGVQTCERKAVIVNAIMKLLSYPDFSSDFGSSRLTITNIVDPQGKCGTQIDWVGCTGSGNGFKTKNIDGGKYKDDYWTYIITHEMFHVVDARTNNSYRSSYDYQTYFEDEPSCYSAARNGVFRTYQLTPPNGSVDSESMAESGAVYVIGYGGTGNFSNFESDCTENYDFWTQKIGLPQDGGSVGGINRTGKQTTFTVGNHTVITNYASSETCNGKYDLSNASKFPIGNFGDPNCDASQNAIIDYIKASDPLINTPFCSSKNGKCYNRIDVWTGIVTCESHFNPNDLGKGKSGWGAWGMFQMNPDFRPHTAGSHDIGTVDWKTQIVNAITRNNVVSKGKFGYFGCSRGYRNGTK